LNRNIIFVTVTFVVLILFFSSQVDSKRCQTIIKTRHFTKTIYPNCPPKCTTTTTTYTNFIKSTTITTTTTTSTTTSTSYIQAQPTTLKKRNQKIICIPDKNCVTLRKHGKCTKIFYCTPTIILRCPKVHTKTITSAVRSTSLSVSVLTETINESVLEVILCPSTCKTLSEICNVNGPNATPCQCCDGLSCKPNETYNQCLPT